ncbi:MAG TPA: patatin-like phospholipase family protein, partial [Bacteroidota bacterium]|nr:patatin-like phospholipase family protein [Bacteroidota bacterium]
KLDLLESWVRGMNTRNVVKYFDIRLVVGGGFVEGRWLMDFLRERFGDVLIENLPKPFAAVATDLKSGREVWLRSGSLWDAVRASIALPGFITPVRVGDQWLVDGGLVNPVPVSLCRSMGAEWIVAVNLNGDIVGRHFNDRKTAGTQRQSSTEKRLLEKLTIRLKEHVKTGTPGLFDVLAGAINIMQDRITVSRLADHPPDVLITPRLAHIGLLEFDRAAEAIEEGRQAVRRAAQDLHTVGEQSTSTITREGSV